MTHEQLTTHWKNLSISIFDIETKPRKHEQYFLMQLGRKFPATLAHAKYWIKNELKFDVISDNNLLNAKMYFDKINFTPEYKFTKSKTFVRLVNSDGLNQCIINHFKTNNVI